MQRHVSPTQRQVNPAEGRVIITAIGVGIFTASLLSLIFSLHIVVVAVLSIVATVATFVWGSRT
jgi:hypothetical protein